MFGSTPVKDAEFVEFVQNSTNSLSWTAYLLTGDRDQASELLQEALVRTYLAWRRVRPGEAVAYTRRILVNLNVDRLRRRRSVPLEHDLPERSDPQGAVESRDQLVRLLARLPVQQRTVIVLRYFDDLSEAEVASHLGISVGAVKSAASRGLASLRTDHARQGEPR